MVNLRQVGRTAAVLIIGAVLSLYVLAQFCPSAGSGRCANASSIPPSSKPCSEHLLGTDEKSADVLSNLILATRTNFHTLLYGLLPFLIGGIGLGLYAGFGSGRFGVVCDTVLEFLGGLPKILIILITQAAVSAAAFPALVGLFGLLSALRMGKLIRIEVTQLRSQQFVEASIALGHRLTSILFRQILWHNCRRIVLSETMYFLSAVTIIEATISYLELGLDFTIASWGRMIGLGEEAWGTWIRETRDAVPWVKQVGSPVQALAPMLAITIVVLVFQILGDMISRRFDPTADRQYG